jgi:hypothetical protein
MPTFAAAPVYEVHGARVAGAQRGEGAADPQEMARRMILGGQSTASLAKIRLTSKPE